MATLEAIQEKIKNLQTQAEALIAKKAQAALEQIRKLMIEHGLTTEEIEAAAKAKRDAKFLKTSITNVKPTAKTKTKTIAAKPKPKYQDKKSGATWSGYGRAPAWIVDAKDRKKFLIADEVAKTEVSTTNILPVLEDATKKPAAKKVAAKKTFAKKAVATLPAAKKAASRKAVTKKVAAKNTL